LTLGELALPRVGNFGGSATLPQGDISVHYWVLVGVMIKAFLVTCGKLLEPEGLLVLTTVNVDSWERLIRPGEWSGATDAQHKILFTKYSLAFLLARTGFSVNVMAAPIRKIEFLGALQPGFGGQLFCVCKLRKQA
jgi:hypothetical protein